MWPTSQEDFPVISCKKVLTLNLLLLQCINLVNFKAWGKRSPRYISLPLPPSSLPVLSSYPTSTGVDLPSTPSFLPAYDPLLLFSLTLSSRWEFNSDAKYNSFFIMRPEREGEIICFSREGMGWRWHRKNGKTVTDIKTHCFLSCHNRVHRGILVSYGPINSTVIHVCLQKMIKTWPFHI